MTAHNPTSPPFLAAQEIVEPRFQMITNETETVMLVISRKEEEPLEPSLYCDGKEALLLRRPEQAVWLVNFADSAKEPLQQAQRALVVETEDGSISFGEGNQIESEIFASYELEITRVEQLPGKKKPRPGWLVFADRVGRFISWMLVLFLMGLGFQVFYSGDRSYKVTSPLSRSRALVQKRNIRYLPKRKFYSRIFWTYIVKSKKGKFFYPAKEKNKIRVLKPRYVRYLQLRPVFTFWYRHGATFLLSAFLLASFLLSFTSVNVYDMLKNAIVDGLKDASEDSTDTDNS